jgi:ParB family transcriptional regulator, chromosome partitioning protein
MASPNNKKDLLGKGIRSLLSNIDNDLKNTAGTLKQEIVQANTAISRIPLDKIEPNKEQPRTDFDETALSELSASIRLHDVIQPITVTAIGDKYKIISGERRYRAAKLAGLKDIPAYVRKLEESNILELALLENLQREDLNAIEIGLSYKRLLDELDYTQEQLAERMSKDRSSISHHMRLLKLPPDIQVAVCNGDLSMGHARCLINVEGVDKQLYLFKEIKAKGLNVRQTEDLVRTLLMKEGKTVKKIEKGNLEPAFQRIQDKLASHFGTKVNVKHSKKGNGSITLEYYSLDELNQILKAMQVEIK